jgi:hypothetical protein
MVMETILNVTWLLIALGSFGAFRVWAADLPEAAVSSRQKRRVGLALVCVLAILFPIISVTDDLRIDAATLDEWTAARRASTVLCMLLVAVVARCSALSGRPAGQPLRCGSPGVRRSGRASLSLDSFPLHVDCVVVPCASLHPFVAFAATSSFLLPERFSVGGRAVSERRILQR